LRLSLPEEFPTTLQQLTGSEKHNTQLHNWAAEQGLKLNERGLYDSDEGRREIQSETQLYTELGLAFIEPELRQGAGELEVAAQASLPSLVTLDDIRGDLHMHTRWSDGAGTLEEMMRAGRELDYEYIAISDHSESLVIANGLTADELRRQVERIAEYNEQHEGLHVLTSIEVDILGDGSLDFPDSLLAELDIVTASVHSSFEQDREVMTRRLLRAMENPQVDVIGHLTGRLLNRRDAYELELDQLIQKAAETGTALELNASPDRLDIDGGTARKAREAGVPVVVNTDAHAVGTLEDMVWGVNQARRGWLEPSDIINCLELSALLDFLGAPKADRSL
jgi:DNA polymerase (family 10)